MTEAIEYHEREAKVFKKKYLDKKSFKSRLLIWEDLIKGNKVQHAMDLNCGPGWMTQILCEISDKVAAIDGSEEMIAQSRETLGASVSKVEFVNASITPQLLGKWPAESFDLVISSSVLEYVDDADQVLEKIFTLLARDGRLIFSLPNRDSLFRKIEGNLYNWFGRPQYRGLLINVWDANYSRALLESFGFKVEKVQFQGYVPVFSQLFFWLPERYRKPMTIFVAKK